MICTVCMAASPTEQNDAWTFRLWSGLLQIHIASVKYHGVANLSKLPMGIHGFRYVAWNSEWNILSPWCASEAGTGNHVKKWRWLKPPLRWDSQRHSVAVIWLSSWLTHARTHTHTPGTFKLVQFSFEFLSFKWLGAWHNNFELAPISTISQTSGFIPGWPDWCGSKLKLSYAFSQELRDQYGT